MAPGAVYGRLMRLTADNRNNNNNRTANQRVDDLA